MLADDGCPWCGPDNTAPTRPIDWAYCDLCNDKHDLLDPDLTIKGFIPLRFCTEECLIEYQEQAQQGAKDLADTEHELSLAHHFLDSLK
jgi:hypothetical protein